MEKRTRRRAIVEMTDAGILELAARVERMDPEDMVGEAEVGDAEEEEEEEGDEEEEVVSAALIISNPIFVSFECVWR